jgi:phosphatidylserine decarboxylase
VNRPAASWRAGTTHRYDDEPLCARGAEYGRFNMGSSVILLGQPGVLRLHDGIRPGSRTRMGETLGWRLHAPGTTPADA